jgi:hypothetical protein
MNKSNNKIRSSFYRIPEISKILKKNSFFKENSLSSWERKILKKFHDSELDIEIKFRNFPLYIEKEKFEYFPDFLIKGFLYKQREIIIEAHEEISEEDVNKYKKFRSVFGVMYYLILIVKDDDFEKWKKIENGVFNEFWRVTEIDLLIENLLEEKKKYNEKIKIQPQSAFCPSPPKGHGCGKKAKGYEEIVRWFGYRGKIVQSLCRQCRSKHAKSQRKKLKTQ